MYFLYALCSQAVRYISFLALVTTAFSYKVHFVKVFMFATNFYGYNK